METEKLKSWLRRYKEQQLYADRLFDRMDDLRGRVESARSSRLDGMPRGSRGDADRIGGVLAELEEVEDEATAAQAEATSVRRELSAAIGQIHGPHWADKREVLRLRYIDGLRWEDCAERLYGDDPRYWGKEDVYLRKAFKLHTQALEELALYVPLSAGQENTEQR